MIERVLNADGRWKVRSMEGKRSRWSEVGTRILWRMPRSAEEFLEVLGMTRDVMDDKIQRDSEKTRFD